MANGNQTPSYIIKVIMLGYTRAGKTALLKKYMDGTFPSKYTPTQPMNLESKRMELDGRLTQVSIWDIGSQMGYDTLLPMYYRGALGAIIVFDLTHKKSFEVVPTLLNEIKKHNPAIPVAIVGNKVDLRDERQITPEEISELMDKLRQDWPKKISYFEVSAKGEQMKIRPIFENLVREIIRGVATDEDEEEVFI
ncbi:MAG: GTP-binding protein [Methanobacteriota archaeon]|nr:MAG: GTP-binding protein [Euryarchaeota archaeon]